MKTHASFSVLISKNINVGINKYWHGAVMPVDTSCSKWKMVAPGLQHVAHVTEAKCVAQSPWPGRGFVHMGAVLEAGNFLCASPQGELGKGVCYCSLKVDAFLLSLNRQGLDTEPALAHRGILWL